MTDDRMAARREADRDHELAIERARLFVAVDAGSTSDRIEGGPFRTRKEARVWARQAFPVGTRVEVWTCSELRPESFRPAGIARRVVDMLEDESDRIGAFVLRVPNEAANGSLGKLLDDWIKVNVELADGVDRFSVTDEDRLVERFDIDPPEFAGGIVP